MLKASTAMLMASPGKIARYGAVSRWTDATQYAGADRASEGPGARSAQRPGCGERARPDDVRAAPVRADGLPATRHRRAARRRDHRDGPMQLWDPAAEHVQSRCRAALRAPGLSPHRRHEVHPRHDDRSAARKDREMNPATAPRTARLTSIAPQFLVDDLDAALAYYRERLGFA